MCDDPCMLPLCRYKYLYGLRYNNCFITCLDNQPMAPAPPYPVLPNMMTVSGGSPRQQQQHKHVKVLHAYDAQHDDELTIRPSRIHLFLFIRFHIEYFR